MHAQQLESMIERLIDPITTQSSGALEVAHADLITARLRLLASDEAFGAWKALREAEETFMWNTSQDFPGLGHTYEELPADYPAVVGLREKLEAFYAATRTEFVARSELKRSGP